MTSKPREELHYKQVYPNFDVTKDLKVNNSVDIVIKKKSNSSHFTFPEIRSNAKYEKQKIDFSQIDYNMDSKDMEFLKEQGIKIDISLFELIFDRMEKEWYFFTHSIIKKTFTPFESFDNVCNICSFSHFSITNNLIFCDGCNICVHQECYGVPLIPPGPWFCKPCVHKASNLQCRFCIKIGGAYKMTNSSKWGHVVCVLWNKELFFSNLVYLEPIEDHTKSFRFIKKTVVCAICNESKGMHIECAYLECDIKYHVTCAIEENLYMDSANLLTYCFKHNPLRDLKYNDSLVFYPELTKRPQIRNFIKLAKPKKSLLLHIKMLKPFISTYFVDKIYCNDICQFDVPKDVLIKILLYWKKKKRILFLAPLIPHLFLDVNGGIGWDWYESRFLFCVSEKLPVEYLSHEQKYKLENEIQEEKPKRKKKLSFDFTEQKAEFNQFKKKIQTGCHHKKLYSISDSEIQYIFEPVGKMHEMTTHLCAIKKLDLEMLEIRKEMVQILKNRQNYIIKNVMGCLDRSDYEIFKMPVTESIAPHYFDFIKKPMDFEKIHTKINSYHSLNEFFSDLHQIGLNCLIYNKDVDFFEKIAKQFLKEVQECEILSTANLTEKLNISFNDLFP